MAANVGSGAFGFATASVVAWQFGPTGLGATAFAASLIAYATLITTCGTEIYAVRIGAASGLDIRRLASSVITIRLCLATLVYAAIVAITFVVPAFREVQSLVLLFGLSVFTIAFDISWLPQAIQRTNVFAAGAVSTQGIALLLLLASLAFSAELLAVPISRVAAEACVAAGFLFWMRNRVGSLAPSLPKRELWQLLRESAPIGGTQLLRGFALGSDLIILGLFVSATDLGLYSATFKIFQLLLGLIASYFIILLPRIAERAHDGHAMADELSASFRRVIPLALIAMALLATVAGPLLRILFGADFAGGASSLRILAAALLVNVSLRHYRQILLARGLQSEDLRSSTIGGLVHVGSKVALVPALGIVGAALGTLIGETVMFFLQRRAALRAIAAAQGMAPVAGSTL